MIEGAIVAIILLRGDETIRYVSVLPMTDYNNKQNIRKRERERESVCVNLYPRMNPQVVQGSLKGLAYQRLAYQKLCTFGNFLDHSDSCTGNGRWKTANLFVLILKA